MIVRRKKLKFAYNVKDHLAKGKLKRNYYYYNKDTKLAEESKESWLIKINVKVL
jgi:hypothetical protein